MDPHPLLSWLSSDAPGANAGAGHRILVEEQATRTIGVTSSEPGVAGSRCQQVEHMCPDPLAVRQSCLLLTGRRGSVRVLLLRLLMNMAQKISPCEDEPPMVPALPGMGQGSSSHAACETTHGGRILPMGMVAFRACTGVTSSGRRDLSPPRQAPAARCGVRRFTTFVYGTRVQLAGVLWHLTPLRAEIFFPASPHWYRGAHL